MGGLLVDLRKVNLLDAGMPRNLSEHSAVPAANHQHLLRLALLHQQRTASLAVPAQTSTPDLMVPAGAGVVS